MNNPAPCSYLGVTGLIRLNSASMEYREMYIAILVPNKRCYKAS